MEGFWVAGEGGNESDFYFYLVRLFHVFLYIHWYKLTQNLVTCALKENAFFGILMLAYLKLI